MRNSIEFATPSGARVSGYLARPAGEPRAGVVVLQEWWGLNDSIRAVADDYAREGFLALAPDIYHGRVTEAPDEAEHLMNGLDWVGATREDVRGAAQLLAAERLRVAVSGYCLGGALTVIAATSLPEVDAAVCFYGIPPRELAEPAAIRVPFQGHFAEQDDWCTPAAAMLLERALAGAGGCFEIHRYDAPHAFCNPASSAYRPDAAALARVRSLDFLRRWL